MLPRSRCGARFPRPGRVPGRTDPPCPGRRARSTPSRSTNTRHTRSSRLAALSPSRTGQLLSPRSGPCRPPCRRRATARPRLRPSSRPHIVSRRCAAPRNSTRSSSSYRLTLSNISHIIPTQKTACACHRSRAITPRRAGRDARASRRCLRSRKLLPLRPEVDPIPLPESFCRCVPPIQARS